MLGALDRAALRRDRCFAGGARGIRSGDWHFIRATISGKCRVLGRMAVWARGWPRCAGT